MSCVSCILVNSSETRAFDGASVRPILPVENSLAILVKLEFSNDAVRWLKTNIHLSTISFITRDPLDMDYILTAVAGCDFALAILIDTADDHHFIIFANGDGSNIVLCLELL